jgi:hypothetical protein
VNLVVAAAGQGLAFFTVKGEVLGKILLCARFKKIRVSPAYELTYPGHHFEKLQSGGEFGRVTTRGLPNRIADSERTVVRRRTHEAIIVRARLRNLRTAASSVDRRVFPSSGNKCEPMVRPGLSRTLRRAHVLLR